MTTDAQTFANLLSKFHAVYDDCDQTVYVIEYVVGSDMPIMYDSDGEPILCDDCSQQLHYDSGSISCENEECERNK